MGALAVRLDELFWSSRERRAELLLGLGRIGRASAELESLVAAQPHREHARALLMEALYREGRHADALGVFQAWRHHLGEALGLEPSPELQSAEREILRHTLATAPVTPPGGRPASPPVPVSSFVGRDEDLASLAAWQNSGSWTAQWVTLRTLVDLLAQLGATEDTAVLYGAVSAARSGASLYGADEARLRTAAASLRNTLGDAFGRLAHQGEALSDDEVIAAALAAIGRVAGAVS